MSVDRDPDRFAAFDTGVRQLMQQEAAAFVQTRGTMAGTLRDFLTAPGPPLDPPLEVFYGRDPVGAAPLRSGRRGALALGAVLTANSRFDESSVVKRGLFIRERLFCQGLQPPPGPAAPLSEPTAAAGPPASVSPRSRLARHLGDPACQPCHALIDPLGLPFERFDAVGRWRQAIGDEAIDTRSHLLGTDVDGPVADHGGPGRCPRQQRPGPALLRGRWRSGSTSAGGPTRRTR